PPNNSNTPQLACCSTSCHDTTRVMPSNTIANTATQASKSLSIDNQLASGLPAIHKVTVSTKMASTSQASRDAGNGMAALPATHGTLASGLMPKNNTSSASGNNIANAGMPTCIQSLKSQPSAAAAIALGGLPTSVAIPPRFADQASASKRNRR